jgi:hypothetical protein
LRISKASEENHLEKSFYRQRPTSSYINKDLSKFYDPVYTITFTITNTGNIDGSEVSQLYLHFPEEADEPPKVLRGFERVYLEAGESKTVTLPLTQRDISYWNVVNLLLLENIQFLFQHPPIMLTLNFKILLIFKLLLNKLSFGNDLYHSFFDIFIFKQIIEK